jgi:hypothetical protein
VTNPMDVDEVVVIIGGRGRLSYTEGKLAAGSFISSHQRYKNAKFSIALDGFDDARDELLKHDDAVGYVALVLSEVAKCLGDDIAAWRLSSESAMMIARILSKGLTEQ